MSSDRRVWRVRAWIRAASLLVSALLFWMQLASPSWGVPESEVDQGWYWMVAMCAVVLYLAWVPYVSVGPDGRWVMQGWTRRLTTTVDDYRGYELSPFGLRVELEGGRSFTCVIFQDTEFFKGEPRYFDFIEALSGDRPTLT